MSTSFDVFPGNTKIPTCKSLLELANLRVNHFLLKHGLPGIALRVSFLTETANQVNTECTGHFYWNGDTYAWFYVENVHGGTDAYCRDLKSDELHRESLEIVLEDAEQKHSSPVFRETLRNTLNVGRYWTFRRSMGQPAIINVSYGMLAAALAELTNGMINSEDGAWHSESLPMRAEPFIATWFNPDVESSARGKEWFRCGLDMLAEELL